jgi:hypothetical protein
MRALLLATCALSCGRIGYGLLPDQASDAGADGRSDHPGGPGGADANGADAGLSGGDGAPDAPSAVGDAGVEGGPIEAQAEAAPTPVDAGPDGADAGLYPSCSSVAIRWDFEFTSDPTMIDALDGSADGTPDWTVRGGGAFPVSELDGGVWWSAMQTPLDTRPLDDFSNRVIVDVRMLSATVAPPNRGAVFWINLNEDAPQFAALFASAVAQPDGGQAVTLFGKPDANAEAPIVTFSNLPSSFINLHLDIDPTTLRVGLWIDQTFEGTYSFPPTGAPNADEFATLLSWTGLSGFASVRIVECAN